jgi:membrane fusion protein (multidrug efflux system)
MYVNVRLTIGTLNRAFLIPQAALLRDAKGPYILTVGDDKKVMQKRVTADTTNGQDWIVTSGLKEGDRVIVSGTQAARPESLVNSVPYVSPDDSQAGSADAARVSSGPAIGTAPATGTAPAPGAAPTSGAAPASDPPPPPAASKRASAPSAGSMPKPGPQ